MTIEIFCIFIFYIQFTLFISICARRRAYPIDFSSQATTHFQWTTQISQAMLCKKGKLKKEWINEIKLMENMLNYLTFQQHSIHWIIKNRTKTKKKYFMWMSLNSISNDFSCVLYFDWIIKKKKMLSRYFYRRL